MIKASVFQILKDILDEYKLLEESPFKSIRLFYTKKSSPSLLLTLLDGSAFIINLSSAYTKRAE